MPNMFIVSCRRDFWSPTDFSPALEIRELDLAGDGNGPPVTPATFQDAMAGKRVMVLVHGYNTERMDVLDSYGTIDRYMTQLNFLGGAQAPYDALVGFAWPGGAVGVSFPFARGRATDSAPLLAQLLTTLRGAGATVDLNTHSLGAHVALEALREAPAQMVRTAWNFAAAVDNESVEQGERYYSASQGCSKFYVFHSKNDPVLRVWYRIGDLFDFDTALGYSGPEDPRSILDHSRNVRVVNCKDIVASHGGYRSAGQVWSFMAQELSAPTTEQFITLTKSPDALEAVFKAMGGASSLRQLSTNGGARHARRAPARRPARRAAAGRAAAARGTTRKRRASA